MKKLAVIALGGNALLRNNQKGTIDQQEQNSTETLENIVYLLKEGYNVVITHGNGPQVGNIIMRNEAGESLYGIPQMPLDICVADSQGGIGYMIERTLKNVLTKHRINKEVLTLMSMVEVDPDDPAFKNPTKRIGKTFTKTEKEMLVKDKKWIFREVKKDNGGYRRVVPSPPPRHILNWEVIQQNANAGTIVIALGGGGVPVYLDEEKNIRPAEAVIDKDLASAMLANQIGADELYILTDVPFVYKNFGEKNQERLEFLNAKDAHELLDSGELGDGSMAPKLTAALQFIQRGGAKSIITESKALANKEFGTKITLEYDSLDLHKYD